MLQKLSSPNDFLIEKSVLRAFSGDANTVAVPDGVTVIGERAFFRKDHIKHLTFPDSVRELGALSLYRMTGLVTLQLPQGLEAVGKDACAMLAVRALTVPCGVRILSEGAFSYNHSLKSLTLNEGLAEIGASAFCACDALPAVALPQSLKKIGRAAFSACRALQHLDLNEGLESIGAEAFAGCDALREVVIPQSVKEIGYNAFPDSARLTIFCNAPKNLPSSWQLGKQIKLKKI